MTNRKQLLFRSYRVRGLGYLLLDPIDFPVLLLHLLLDIIDSLFLFLSVARIGIYFI